MAEESKWPLGIERQAALLDISMTEAQKISSRRLVEDTDDFDDIVFGQVLDFEVPAVIYQRPNSDYKGFCLVLDLNEPAPVGPFVERFLKKFGLDNSVVSWLNE